MFSRLVALGVVALFQAACSIHPLPEDVTPLDTNAIVFHTRCEARSAIKNAAIAFLLNPNIPVPESTRQKARALADGTTKFEDFDPIMLDPFSRFFLLKYEYSAIAYDFTFDISEKNTAAANLDFLSILSNGTFGLTAGAGGEFQRQSIRNFRVADTFGELRKLTICNKFPNETNNYLYPVTGSIGLDEVVRSFVDLNEFNNLTGSKDSDKVPVKADTFNFQTMLSGSLTPTLTLIPPHANRFNLTSVSTPFTASRTDTHKIVVAMSLPLNAAELARSRSRMGILTLRPVNTTGGKTYAEQRALIEIDNQKTINSLNNVALQPR